MFVADDSSNLHDDSAYINEVVYGANVDQASWRFGREVSTSETSPNFDNNTAAYFRTEMSSAFGTTLPASGSGSHFNFGYVENTTPVGPKTITWTTARTCLLYTSDAADEP